MALLAPTRQLHSRHFKVRGESTLEAEDSQEFAPLKAVIPPSSGTPVSNTGSVSPLICLAFSSLQSPYRSIMSLGILGYGQTQRGEPRLAKSKLAVIPEAQLEFPYQPGR